MILVPELGPIFSHTLSVEVAALGIGIGAAWRAFAPPRPSVFYRVVCLGALLNAISVGLEIPADALALGALSVLVLPAASPSILMQGFGLVGMVFGGDLASLSSADWWVALVVARYVAEGGEVWVCVARGLVIAAYAAGYRGGLLAMGAMLQCGAMGLDHLLTIPVAWVVVVLAGGYVGALVSLAALADFVFSSI